MKYNIFINHRSLKDCYEILFRMIGDELTDESRLKELSDDKENQNIDETQISPFSVKRYRVYNKRTDQMHGVVIGCLNEQICKKLASEFDQLEIGYRVKKYE